MGKFNLEGITLKLLQNRQTVVQSTDPKGPKNRAVNKQNGINLTMSTSGTCWEKINVCKLGLENWENRIVIYSASRVFSGFLRNIQIPPTVPKMVTRQTNLGLDKSQSLGFPGQESWGETGNGCKVITIHSRSLMLLTFVSLESQSEIVAFNALGKYR